jgi:hypothetical protein
MSSLLALKLDNSPYTADVVEGRSGRFLSITGAKKGSHHKGGGIAIPDLRSLDNLLDLIRVIEHLKVPRNPNEERVAFCSEKNRFLSGETKLCNEQWFYRIKVYRNFFIDNEGGFVAMRGHGLRPDGFRFFIKEMDFPINNVGKQFAAKFTAEISKAVEKIFTLRYPSAESDLLEEARQTKMLVSGNQPWIFDEPEAKAIRSREPLIDMVCQCLMDDPYTEESLAAKLHINSRLSASFTNPSARYAPEFLAREIVIDRLRGKHGNLQYQATKIPRKALELSPMLTDLLDDKAKGDWSSWKKVTFSNDQYPQDRSGCLSYANFEVEAFCGGRAWGVPLDISKARATALRLFDLKRYFEKQEKEMDEVRTLCKRFTKAVLTT